MHLVLKLIHISMGNNPHNFVLVGAFKTKYLPLITEMSMTNIVLKLAGIFKALSSDVIKSTCFGL